MEKYHLIYKLSQEPKYKNQISNKYQLNKISKFESFMI